MEKIALTFFLSICVLATTYAQNLSQQIIGTWSVIDVKFADLKGKDLKVTPALKKQASELKKIFTESPTELVFNADGTATTPDGASTWTLKGNQLFLTAKEGDDTQPKPTMVKIVNGNLEMAEPEPDNKRMIVLILKKK